jgi:NAD-dependent dihydropyrimidine dehydrogenase PreA subunit
MAFVISEACMGVKDKKCLEVCPVQCFYEGADQLFIQAEACIDCGACETVCPVHAIYPDRDLPEDHRSAIEKASRFFLENPGIEPALGSTRS